MSPSRLRLSLRWPLVIAGVFFVYALLLLGNAVRDRNQLREAGEARLVADSQRRAVSLGEFAGERIHLTEDLSGLNELNTYLASKDLGMSPLYGLNASLEALEQRLRIRVQTRKPGLHGAYQSPFTRIVVFDEDGQPLADSGGAIPMKALPAAAAPRPGLMVDTERRAVVASAPVVFKGRFSGTIVTTTDIGELYHSLIPMEAGGRYREILLTRDGREIEAPGGPPAFVPAIGKALVALVEDRPTRLDGIAGAADLTSLRDAVAVLAAVPGAPLFLLTVLPREGLEGGLASTSFLVSMAAFPLVLLFVALRLNSLEGRAQALEKDAVRSVEQRQVLEGRNESLEEEIRRRQAVEAELQTHREHLEELVDRRSAELNRLFHALPDLYFRARRDGTILECRAGTRSDLLRPASEMLGHRMQDLVPADASLRLVEALDDIALGSDQVVFDYSLQLDKGLQYFEGRMLPLGHDQIVLVVRNVTELRQLEIVRDDNRREAERLARVKSEFLTNMSHEIRTPLNAVLGLAQVGARAAEAGAQARFKPIEEAGRHLLAIVNDILDFSKLETGKLSVERAPFRLAELVEAASALVVGRTQAKGLALKVELSPGLPEWVDGDALRIKQVLVNLLGNAIKFTERGSVRLTVRPEGGRVAFQVADTGIGISQEQLMHLFRPFEQADGSTTRRFGGTGLGLAISHNLVQLMGGEIGVTSQPGEGSVFTLRLPLAAASAPVAEAPADAAAGRRLAGLRVLAAEDNEVNRMVLQGQLELEGAQVAFATNGQEAVDAVAQGGPAAFHAVLMDVQMPVMDGLEATRRIRGLAPLLPVIGLTAHALAEERERCLAAGMVEHVAKPVELDALVAALRRHTGALAPA